MNKQQEQQTLEQLLNQKSERIKQLITEFRQFDINCRQTVVKAKLKRFEIEDALLQFVGADVCAFAYAEACEDKNSLCDNLLNATCARLVNATAKTLQQLIDFYTVTNFLSVGSMLEMYSKTLTLMFDVVCPDNKHEDIEDIVKQHFANNVVQLLSTNQSWHAKLTKVAALLETSSTGFDTDMHVAAISSMLDDKIGIDVMTKLYYNNIRQLKVSYNDAEFNAVKTLIDMSIELAKLHNSCKNVIKQKCISTIKSWSLFTALMPDLCSNEAVYVGMCQSAFDELNSQLNSTTKHIN